MFGIGDPNKKGMASLEKGDYANAITEFKRVLIKNQKDWQAYAYLGDTYRRLGQHDEAIDNYKKSLSYNSEAIESYEGLAASYADKGIKFDEAIAILNKTREILKNDPSVLADTEMFYLHGLSWIHFQQGETKKAIKYFDEAYPLWQKSFQQGTNELDPYFSDVHYQFGILLSYKGEKKKAYSEFQKAIKCAPTSIFAKKAKEAMGKTN